ncbi:MAG: oligosaccharide flippase family protein [Ginsengibacter sp.]
MTDSFWALLGNVVGKGLAFFSAILVARILGKATFGEFSILKSTLQSFAIFSTLGFGYTATKYVADFKTQRPHQLKTVLRYVTNITLIIGIVFTILVAFLSGWISLHILKAPQLVNNLLLFAIWIIFYSVWTTQLGILAGFKAFKQLARISLIIGVVTFVLTLTFTYFFGLNGAIFALVVSQGINCILNKLQINRFYSIINLDLKNDTSRDRVLLRELFHFTMPVALQEISFVVSGWVLNILLVNYSNYGEVGLYSVTLQWVSLILFIPGILRNVVLSHLSSSVKHGDRHGRIIKITALFNLIVTFLPASLVFVFSKSIAQLYGETFKGLAPILTIAVFSTIFSSMTNVYTQAYLSLGRNWLMFRIRLFRDFFLVGLAWFFLYLKDGLNGAFWLSMTLLIVYSLYFFICYMIYTFLLQKRSF